MMVTFFVFFFISGFCIWDFSSFNSDQDGNNQNPICDARLNFYKIYDINVAATQQL